MTVAQNVGYGLVLRRRPKAEIARRVDETLEIVGLSGLRDRYPAQLSGGQKQRVALARAIVCEPKLILLDEPLAALDARLRRQMQVFLKQIQRQIQTTFIFVTHDQDEAITMSDRIVVMSQAGSSRWARPRISTTAADPLRCNSDTRGIGGTGLGLALVREIIHAHQGNVWVESTLKSGSTFFFTLPFTRLDT